MPYTRKRQKEYHLAFWGLELRRQAAFGWVRKQQCNFGWDWGIKAVTAGIWRPIRLVAFNTARLTDLHILQEHADGRVDLAVRGAGGGRRPRPVWRRTSPCRIRASRLAEAMTTLRRGRGTASLDHRQIPSSGGRTIWAISRFMTCEVELRCADGRTIDTQCKRIGLRTLRLDRHADQWGESFQFVVNGVPFFAKGANWIPDDGILSRMTPARYRQRIADAAGANMNMLRVWGGGLYEDDSFYDACDEMGITVWQDFMFACSAYPCHEAAFRKSVEAEARDNVRRLRHHPCMALWCGNNEVEQGLSGERCVRPVDELEAVCEGVRRDAAEGRDRRLDPPARLLAQQPAYAQRRSRDELQRPDLRRRPPLERLARRQAFRVVPHVRAPLQQRVRLPVVPGAEDGLRLHAARGPQHYLARHGAPPAQRHRQHHDHAIHA